MLTYPCLRIAVSLYNRSSWSTQWTSRKARMAALSPTANMDHVIWTYPVWINETTPDTTPAGYSDKYKYIHRWKHKKGFTIDFPRMAVLVNDALRYTEANFKYSNSFKRLQLVSCHINNFAIIE